MYRELPQLVDVRGDIARDGSYDKRDWSVITDIARHHSAEDAGDAFAYANYHVHNLGWPSVGYHFVITKDGTIQWANSVERITYGVGQHNTPIINVCVVGNGSFTDEQEQSFYDLYEALVDTDGLNIQRLKGHNEYSGHSHNACPGINMDQVRKAMEESHPVGGKIEGSGSWEGQLLEKGDNGAAVEDLQEQLLEVGEALPEYGADGDYGEETACAVKSFQSEHDLAVDGVAGPETFEAMEEALVIGQLALIVAESVNIRKEPKLDDDSVVAGQVHEGEAFTIVGVVQPEDSETPMFELKSGLFITTYDKYVEVV